MSTRTLRTVAACLAMALLSLATRAAESPAPPAPTLIRNVTIIDVGAGKPIPGRTVLIKGGIIDSITSGVEAVVPPEGATIIDGAGLYLIPGLFDAHVHYVEPETFGRLMVANGVTFVRDLGNATESILSTRDRLNRGELLGPRMIATGAIIDGDPPVWPFSEACDTEEEARAAVRKLHGAGAGGVDQIKVYSRLKPEVYRAAVDEARKLGLKAVGHIPGACTVDDAISAGQASVEHFSRFESVILDSYPATRGGAAFRGLRAWALLSDERNDVAALRPALEKVAAAGMVQCPTIVVIAGVGESADAEAAAKNPLLAYVPTELRTFWSGGNYAAWAEQARHMVAPMQRMLKAMHEAGVPLIVGTDLANPYVFAGFSVHREMQLWADAGIPAADILRAATLTPAEFCGVADRYGTIAEGKRASLVLLEANPLDDIANTQKIHTVSLDGRIFDRAALDALLAETREIVTARTPAAAGEGGEVDLAVPGEVIARGRYRSKFGQFDAGVEDFVISRDADGTYHLKAHSQPSGGFQKPAVVTLHAGPDFTFASGGYRELTQKPTIAAYLLAEGRFEARNMTEPGDPPPPQTLDAPEAWLFTAPVYASDFLTLQHAGLKPGETRAFTAIGFGWNQPVWHLGATEMELTRHDDTMHSRAGETVRAQRYTSSMTTPMGVIKGETLTDAQGLPLKSTITLPFGVITAELQ